MRVSGTVQPNLAKALDERKQISKLLVSSCSGGRNKKYRLALFFIFLLFLDNHKYTLFLSLFGFFLILAQVLSECSLWIEYWHLNKVAIPA